MSEIDGRLEALERARRELAKMRQALAQAKAAKVALLGKLQELPEYRAWQKAEAEAKACEDTEKAMARGLRDIALDVFRLTGDKHPAPAVNVVMRTVYRYDEATLFEWLYSNAPNYLVVDAKRVEAAADTLKGAPIEIEKEPQIRLDTDLSEFLPPAAPEPVAA